MLANLFKKLSYPTLLLSTLLIAAVSLPGCKKNRHKVDIDDIQVDVKVIRYDHELSKIDSINYDAQIMQLMAKYPRFTEYYTEYILLPQITGYRPLTDSMARFGLMKFLTHKEISQLFAEVDKKHGNLEQLEKDLELMFRYYRFHYPEKAVPVVYTYITGFQSGVSISADDDSIVGIGLDLFLGQDFAPYYTLGIPNYIIRRYEPVNIPAIVANAVASNISVYNSEDKRLINAMINEGKRLYFMDALLPDTHDSTKIGYTKAQLDWCKDYEDMIWKHFVEKKLLYSTDVRENGRYLDEAPFTAAPDVPLESAPKMGAWTGWQIVRSYMNKHKDVTLAQLMAMKDPDKILREAGYKPR